MDKTKQITVEDHYKPSQLELNSIGEFYKRFYLFKNSRAGKFRQLQYNTLEDFLTTSRDLFWTSMTTKSEDLEQLGLDFALPFIRKEVLEFLGRISAQNINANITGDELSMYGAKVLHAMYKKWKLKSKDRVEKFWQSLYGIVNGTLCLYVGWNDDKRTNRYLKAYDPATGQYKIDTEEVKMWDDVFTEIVPLEDMYLEKIWERNIQKQNITIRKCEYLQDDFLREYGEYENSKYVFPGAWISEQSLYYTLLGGTGVLQSDKIQVFKEYNIKEDTYKIYANGVWLNPLSGGVAMPNPFNHKMQPYTWTVFEPIDEKFAYGMSLPFKLKDPHKILNISYTMLIERELRAIDPAVITSDFEAPQIIHGQHKVIPVNDVNAYKEFQLSEASNSFFTMMNSMQGTMSASAQGGVSQAAPSQQPKAAREIMAIESLKQQALGNTIIMYYDMVYQEIMLVLKTALQFYTVGSYSPEKNDILRTITVPDFPLMAGGVGTMKVRITTQPTDELALHFEAVHDSATNGKQTEIIEASPDVLRHLDWFIAEIKLEPEKSGDMEKTLFNEQVLQPLLNVFIPAGLADPAKTYLRFLEKMGEHPSDYTSDKNLTQMLGGWSDARFNLTGGVQSGNILQSQIGMQYGSKSNGGIPPEQYGQ